MVDNNMIKARIEVIRQQQRAFEEEIKLLQDACTHPEFTRGLTIVACVQEIDICTNCGWGKPIDFGTRYNIQSHEG